VIIGVGVLSAEGNMMSKKMEVRKNYETTKYKHCAWKDLTRQQQLFYDKIIEEFKTGKILVDEFRGVIGYYEEEISEWLESQ